MTPSTRIRVTTCPVSETTGFVRTGPELNSKISRFDRLHEFANPLCGSKIHTSSERFEKDAVLVSELFGFVWTEGRVVKKKNMWS